MDPLERFERDNVLRIHLSKRRHAHETVVERWRDERPDDLQRLRDINERYVEDALANPVTSSELAREFFDEVEAETRTAPANLLSKEDYDRMYRGYRSP